MSFLFDAYKIAFIHLVYILGERGGSVLGRRTPERENPPPPCCVLDQDTLLPVYTGNTQEAVAPSRHDGKFVDWDAKLQHEQKPCLYILFLKFNILFM